jgi:hypothetical protein
MKAEIPHGDDQLGIVDGEGTSATVSDALH